MSSTVCGVIGILGFGVDGHAVKECLSHQDDVEKIIVFEDDSEFEEVDLLFRSPGFPLTHSLVITANKKGIPITSSTSFVLQNFEGVTVGITGSNGKTTCTALIEEFLKAEFGEGRVERGGNDGVPRLDLIKEVSRLEECFSRVSEHEAERSESASRGSAPLTREKHNFLILELSSFQLIDCPASPDIAVVLNVSPNHLNWHEDMNEYIAAKRRIVEQGDGHVILNQNDAIVKTFADHTEKEVHWFDDFPSCDLKIKTHPDTIRAAVTTARVMGVCEENIIKVLSEFGGVPHRLEFIREVDGVSYYNDSSATTPESVITACEMFDEGTMILLLGGQNKGMDFSNLYDVIRLRKVRVVPYGEMAQEFAENIENCVAVSHPTDFPSVIEAARSHAKTGDSIVLSPACASFDMFKNAKERGNAFCDIIRSL